MPSHKVTCVVKRVGGGFGGKESRFISGAGAVAIAARELDRPVRLALDRHEDMQITGQRHPFLVQYKVGGQCCARTWPKPALQRASVACRNLMLGP